MLLGDVSSRWRRHPFSFLLIWSLYAAKPGQAIQSTSGHYGLADTIRLWDADDLVRAVLANYERLPDAMQADLPLKRIWTLVQVDEE